MSRQFAVAAAAAALLCACAAPTGQQLVAAGADDLAAAPLCCKTLAQAQRKPLPLGGAEGTPLAIDRTAQVFDFGGNRAFFVLFELPRFEKTYSLRFTSRGAGRGDDMALFIPRVALYDADFKPTRYFDEKTLRNRGNDLERTVFFNPKDAGERYVAVYGSDLSSTIERNYSAVTVQTVSTGLVFFNLYGGRDGKSTLRSSPVGNVLLEVQGLP